MNLWLSLSIYLTLISVGVVAGALLAVAIARALGYGADPAWAIGAAVGGVAGVWLARRVAGQWSKGA